MPKKMHPSEISDRARARACTRFNVHLRFGPFSKVNAPCATLEAAIAIRQSLWDEHGKEPLIYAIDDRDNSIHVDRALIAEIEAA